jgi:hypothetical protein
VSERPTTGCNVYVPLSPPVADEEYQWHPTGRREPELAKMLFAAFLHRDGIIALDPWIPVPQERCNALFGDREEIAPRQRHAPLPIGVLFKLWAVLPEGYAFSQCTECHAATTLYTFSAGPARGGFYALCHACGREHYREVGGITIFRKMVQNFLVGSPYYLSKLVCPAAWYASRSCLYDALVSLGAKDLPDGDWAHYKDPASQGPAEFIPSPGNYDSPHPPVIMDCAKDIDIRRHLEREHLEATGALMSPQQVHEFGIHKMESALEERGWSIEDRTTELGRSPQLVIRSADRRVGVIVETAVHPAHVEMDDDRKRFHLSMAQRHGLECFFAPVRITNAEAYCEEDKSLPLIGAYYQIEMYCLPMLEAIDDPTPEECEAREERLN